MNWTMALSKKSAILKACSSLAPPESFQKLRLLRLWIRGDPPAHYCSTTFSSKSRSSDLYERRSWSWDIRITFRSLDVDFYVHIQFFAFPKLAEEKVMESPKE